MIGSFPPSEKMAQKTFRPMLTYSDECHRSIYGKWKGKEKERNISGNGYPSPQMTGMSMANAKNGGDSGRNTAISISRKNFI